jgi:hypothetical protein
LVFGGVSACRDTIINYFAYIYNQKELSLRQARQKAPSRFYEIGKAVETRKTDDCGTENLDGTQRKRVIQAFAGT